LELAAFPVVSSATQAKKTNTSPISPRFHKLGTSLAIPLHNMKINVVAAFSKVINNLIENLLQPFKAWEFQGENYGSRTLYCHVRG
jgi:hypothetical protein